MLFKGKSKGPSKDKNVHMDLWSPCEPFVKTQCSLSTILFPMYSSGEDRAEGASFWYAFLTPFWGPKKLFCSKDTDAEAYVWPKSDARQSPAKV